MSGRLRLFITAVPERPQKATPSSISDGVGAYLRRDTSSCGGPEPSTGIRFPRGQRSHAWRSRVKWLSSRIARSRYFSRISSSVAGIPPTGFTPLPGSPCPCNSTPAATGDGAGDLAPAGRTAGGGRGGAGLEELQGLDVGVAQGRGLARDVGVAERFEELLGAVEVAHADADRPEALGDVAVAAAPADDPVLGGEADRLLVERGQRDARVEDLDRVDVADDREHVLVVGDRVHAVERVRDVDEPALAADLRDRLLERHPARDLVLDEEADHLALVGGLDLLGDDHLDAVGALARGERARDLVVVGHGDGAEAARLRRLEQRVDRRRAVGRVV